MADLLPPPRPIPIKERLSVLYIERGQLDVLDGAFVVVDVSGVRTHIPEPRGAACCALLVRVPRTLGYVSPIDVEKTTEVQVRVHGNRRQPSPDLLQWLRASRASAAIS